VKQFYAENTARNVQVRGLWCVQKLNCICLAVQEAHCGTRWCWNVHSPQHTAGALRQRLTQRHLATTAAVCCPQVFNTRKMSPVFTPGAESDVPPVFVDRFGAKAWTSHTGAAAALYYAAV
jgi:hypothetical protein